MVVKRATITLVNILFPPIAVYMLCGMGRDFMINCSLFLLAVFPSHIHAFYLSWTYFNRKRRVRAGKYPGGRRPMITSEKVQNGGASPREVKQLKRATSSAGTAMSEKTAPRSERKAYKEEEKAMKKERHARPGYTRARRSKTMIFEDQQQPKGRVRKFFTPHMTNPQGGDATTVYSHPSEEVIARRKSTHHQPSRHSRQYEEQPISSPQQSKRSSRLRAIMPSMHKDKEIYEDSYDRSPVSDIEHELEYRRPTAPRRHTTDWDYNARGFDDRLLSDVEEPHVGRFSRLKNRGVGRRATVSSGRNHHEERRPPLPDRTWRSGIDSWLTRVDDTPSISE